MSNKALVIALCNMLYYCVIMSLAIICRATGGRALTAASVITVKQ